MKWTEIDGKKALVFDEVPAFLFVSADGTFRTSSLYLDGEVDRNVTDITIIGELDGIIHYNVGKYGLSKNDALFK